jgi:ATP-dependent RNA helicase DDX1
MSFEEFGLLPELCAAVHQMGWHLPSDVQAECIPLILGGGDVMCASETGTGKTGAFALPLVQIVHETLRDPIKGGEVTLESRQCCMSQVDRETGFAVSGDGLVCQSREAFWQGGRATVGVFRGKYFFEATVSDEGLCRVGWSTRTGKLDLGTDACGFGFGGTGKKSYNKKFEDYGEAYKLGDTVGCYLDADAGVIFFSRNGVVFEKAFEVPKYMRGHILYPAATLKNAEQRFNFGATPFRFPPQPPFVGVCQAAREDTSCLTRGGNSAAEATAGQQTARRPLALILEPLLELAQQTHEELGKFSAFLPEPRVQTGVFVGGQSQQPQLNAIRRGIDIVTATPGRLVDLIQNKSLDVSDVRFLVLDEADRLLESGLLRAVEQIYDALDKSHLQVLLFSATLHSPEVALLSQRICKFPTWVDMKGKDSVPLTVQHVRVVIDPQATTQLRFAPPFDVATDGVHAGDAQARVKNSREQQSEQVKLLKARYLVEIINHFKIEQAIIFIRTRVDAQHLETYFNRLSDHEARGGGSAMQRAYSCLQLHAGKGTDARLSNLEAFKNGDVRFLIATDVAARGIDVKEMPFVINMTLPDKAEDYVHRVGRVGRAGAPGLAISLVAACEEKVWFHSCKDKEKCHNSKLAAKGGCCIWYNEPQLLTAIEERLGGEPVLVISESNHFALPERQLPVAAAPSVLEQEKKRLVAHSEETRPLLTGLIELERELQIGYFLLK